MAAELHKDVTVTQVEAASAYLFRRWQELFGEVPAVARLETRDGLVRVILEEKLKHPEVPNILCETDKYLRVLNGEGKPRALYVPGRGS